MPESVLPQIGAQRVGGNPEQEERHYDVASGKRGGEIIDLDVRVQPLQIWKMLIGCTPQKDKNSITCSMVFKFLVD